MIKQSFEPNTEGIQEALKLIQNELDKKEIKSKEKIKTLLLAEESIYKLAAQADNGSKILVTIVHFFGKTRIYLQSKGNEFDLLASVSDQSLLDLDESVSAATQDYIRNQLFKSFENSLSYKNKHHINSIRILSNHKQMSFFLKALLILVLAVITGICLSNFAPDYVQQICHDFILTPLKKIYLAALNMIVGPVVFFSIALSVASFGSLSSLGKIGLKVLSLYFLTSIIALLLGFGVHYVSSFIPIASLNIQAGEAISAQTQSISLIDTLVSIVPSNFIRPFIEGNMLQIIFLGVFCGITVGLIGDYSKILKPFFEACNELFLEITIILSKCIPAFIFISITLIIMDTGVEALKSIGSLALCILAGFVALIFAYMTLTLIFTRVSPIPLIKKYIPTTALPVFALNSSNASMPLNMKFCEDMLGVSKKVYSFSIPLGATINMDSLTIFGVLVSLFFARVCGIDLTFNDYISFGTAVLLLSIGTPGVPGASAVMITVLFKQLGLPMEILGMGLALAILMDMPRTVLNTLGDIFVTFIAAKSENMVDMKKYTS